MLHDDFGSGYDIIMLNAICHMFSEEQNRDIFRRARKALAPNGRLVVQDFILNPDKTGPLQAALFSVNMLVGTEAGAELQRARICRMDEGRRVRRGTPDQPAGTERLDCGAGEVGLRGFRGWMVRIGLQCGQTSLSDDTCFVLRSSGTPR